MKGATEETIGEVAAAALRKQTPREGARLDEEHADPIGVKKTAHESREGTVRAARDAKHRQLRARLEQAVQSKDIAELEPAVDAVKKEKVPDCSELLDKV